MTKLTEKFDAQLIKALLSASPKPETPALFKQYDEKVSEQLWGAPKPEKAEPDFCDKNCTWLDHHPDCEKADLIDAIMQTSAELGGYEPVAQAPVAWRITRRLANDPYNKIPFVVQAEPLEVQPGTLVEPLYLANPDQTAEIERLNRLLADVVDEVDKSNRALHEKNEQRIATLEAALRKAIAHLRPTLCGSGFYDELNKALGEQE